jgi:hypothetical protein
MRSNRASAGLDCGSGGQLREEHGGAPVDLGDRVGVVPQGGRAAAAVAEAGGGVTQVEAASKELAGGVVPSALDVELHPGHDGGLGDLVRGPVRVRRTRVSRVVGEEERLIVQFDADGRELGPDLA